jgi:hypothetical protein
MGGSARRSDEPDRAVGFLSRNIEAPQRIFADPTRMPASIFSNLWRHGFPDRFAPERLRSNLFSGVMAGHGPSKTGVNALVSRPSTPCWLKRRKEDVDARDERGHDGGERVRLHRNVPRIAEREPG